MSLQAVWQDLYDSRLDWAHRAYDLFMDSLDPRVRACFADGGTEASVVLFGRSQVGKTTLLLNVLGIDEQHLARVSQVLRGGRSAGQSSTATAMQYRCAADDNWYLKIQQQQIRVSQQQLVEKLAQLRSHVENGLPSPEDPVEVGIPQKYFSALSRTRPQVRILDLPGDNPQNQQEALHVRQIAGRYLPMADLILIVGKLDDLSFLNPKAFALPGISDWRYTPNRFRIITTFSFSLQSEVEWAKCQTELDASTVRAHVMSQIETHNIDLRNGADLAHLYFPLDFGESWQNTRIGDPDTFRRMDGINTQLMDELLVDIANSATVHGRLRQAADSHIVATRLKQEESQRMHVELERLMIDKNRRKDLMKQAKNLVVIQKDKVTEALVPSFGLQERLEILQKCQQGISCPSCISNLSGLATDTDALIQRISECCNHLIDVAGALEARDILPFNIRSQNPVERAPKKLREQLDRCFSSLHQTFNGYAHSEYFPWLSNSFDEDRAQLRDLMERATQLTIHFTAGLWWDVVESFLRDKVEKLHREKSELATRESALRESERRYARSRTNVTQQKKRLSDFEQEMDAEVARGERFSRYLNDAFDEELAERRRVISDEPSIPRRLLQLLGCKALCDERDKLFG
ncbi:hypothetical protein [Pseudomonas sp. 13B_3.2_Bac1]|uniref:hypothetical protein n=1 Tax=Pseudomonas sp. 13B_3.2_Bac1 TaxID=2971623 RepID=UPI0021CA0343|nr:hypothetical protein [Pseudomonas sp. 13B_3.2_Bac1]MCU1772891.1 hypothetical protein [Pseudomonas sp. 13B_3.2_Bac1]